MNRAAYDRAALSACIVRCAAARDAERDSATTHTLSVCADLTSRQVWGLLKAPRYFGQVRFDAGRWSLVREFAGRDVERAAALLRDLGWRVEPPSSKNELAGLVNARRTTMENRLNFSSLPALGQPLEAGIFAGLTTNPDGTHCAVVLLADKPANALAWKPAMTWATELNAELPTRPVAALLFANVDDKFDQSWHWTADELDDSNAWNQFFGYGYQDNASKSFKARARAVRLIQLTP